MAEILAKQLSKYSSTDNNSDEFIIILLLLLLLLLFIALYSAILRSRVGSLRSHVILHE